MGVRILKPFHSFSNGGDDNFEVSFFNYERACALLTKFRALDF